MSFTPPSLPFSRSFPISSLAFLFLLRKLLFDMLTSPSRSSALAPLFSTSDAFASRFALLSALLRAFGIAVRGAARLAEDDGDEVEGDEDVTLRAGVGRPRMAGART